jgi:hypothetical protein
MIRPGVFDWHREVCSMHSQHQLPEHPTAPDNQSYSQRSITFTGLEVGLQHSIEYRWSYLACRIRIIDAIWQQCIAGPP